MATTPARRHHGDGEPKVLGQNGGGGRDVTMVTVNKNDHGQHERLRSGSIAKSTLRGEHDSMRCGHHGDGKLRNVGGNMEPASSRRVVHTALRNQRRAAVRHQ
ncbi:hypothetical protein NN561_019391 [Cricetulus griseus]